MNNSYGLPEEALAKIRTRDTHCVYCGVFMPDRADCDNGYDYATVEHLYPPGNDPTWVCFCCNRCNSMHRMPLREWFKTPYCREKGINEQTVADPIQRFLGSGLKEYYMMWLGGREHEFALSNAWKPAPNQDGVQLIEESTLTVEERKLFDAIADEIRHPEFMKWYKDRDPNISRYYGFEYWIEDSKIYRRRYQEKS